MSKDHVLKLRGAEKVAIVMLAISPENTAKIFASLRDDEIKEISQAMASLGAVDTEIIDSVLNDFRQEISTRLSLVGNIETTEKILESALGREKVETILEEIRGPIGKNTWDKLTNINEELLAAYLKNEYPQTIALILSKIASQTAANVLALFPEDLAFEVITRMLHIDSVKKEVLERIENTLRTDFISTLSKVQKRDSHELIADIFNNFDRGTEAKYMKLLQDNSPSDATRVKELMFTFDDIIRLKPGDMVALIRKIDKSKLALALKGASIEIRDLFMKGLSQRAAKILQEDMEAMGPVLLKDVDSAQSSIIVVLKDMVDAGEIIITNNEDKEQYIE